MNQLFIVHIITAYHFWYAVITGEQRTRCWDADVFGKPAPSIHGFGPTTAATLVAQIADIQRFPTPKHFTAFMGLDPRTHQSGRSVHGKGYITKRGNKILRTLFYNCASVAIQRPNVFQDFYQKKVSEGKPKMIALVATTHKMAKVAHAVWKTNTPFDPNHSG